MEFVEFGLVKAKQMKQMEWLTRTKMRWRAIAAAEIWKTCFSMKAKPAAARKGKWINQLMKLIGCVHCRLAACCPLRSQINGMNVMNGVNLMEQQRQFHFQWNCGAASNNQFIFSSSIQSTKPKKFGLLRIEWKEKIEFDWLPGPYFHSIHWFDFIPFPFHENNQWIPFQSLHKLGYFNSTW